MAALPFADILPFFLGLAGAAVILAFLSSGFPVSDPPFTFAHLAFCAAAIFAFPALDILRLPLAVAGLGVIAPVILTWQ